jgi:hypothetical protein
MLFKIPDVTVHPERDLKQCTELQYALTGTDGARVVVSESSRAPALNNNPLRHNGSIQPMSK